MAYELDQTPRPKALGPHAIAATRREGRGAYELHAIAAAK